MSEDMPAVNDPRRASLEVALERARLEVFTVQLEQGMARGIARGVLCATVVAAGLALTALAALSLAAPGGGPGLVFALILVGLGLTLGVASGLLPALRGRPSAHEAALALDHAAGTRDRIATAVQYLGSEAPLSGFQKAAVEDGLEAVRRLGGASAVGPSGPLFGARERRLVPVLIVLTAFAVLLPERELLVSPASADLVAAVDDPVEGPTPGPSTEVPRPDPGTPEVGRPEDRPPTSTEAPRGAAEASRATGTSAEAPGGERTPASGRPGKGRDVEARRARSAAASQGDPTQGEASKPPEESPEAKQPKPNKKSDPTRVKPPRRDEEQKTGSTVGQSGSGGGSMSPVKSPWDQKDKSRDAPLPESAQNEDIDDEIEENEARGGTQPSMKDRRGATSRDLSISGKGEGGDGRGGPSQPKKSRGTASLILGVPLPDFVRGQLNPGTTKVTHERSEPVPTDAGPSTARELPARNVPKLDMGPRGVPPHLSHLIQRVLLRMRGATAPES